MNALLRKEMRLTAHILSYVFIVFGLMALLLFLSYPLTRHKVQELQILKEQKLKESYENKLIDI